jgi:predicted DNA-binding transcriptional regulator YafY
MSVHGRKDRTARLLKLQILLSRSLSGLDVEEIAHICSISKRTAYRDLKALESELDIPIWEDGNKRGIIEGHLLPQITFTPMEAINIVLAIQLMNKLAPWNSPNITSTFQKLITVIPSPLSSQFQEILHYMESKPTNERRCNNFKVFIKAMTSHHRVKIWYQDSDKEGIKEHIIDPYLIEPAFSTHSLYITAYCHLKKRIVKFRTDLIIGNAELLADIYEIPSDFNIVDCLSRYRRSN